MEYSISLTFHFLSYLKIDYSIINNSYQKQSILEYYP